MAHDSELCDTCSQISFLTYFLPPSDGEIANKDGVGNQLYKETQLGTGAELRVKSERCAFCYLAYRASSRASDEATISICSISCGRTQKASETEEMETYYICVISTIGTAQFHGYIQLLVDDACIADEPQDFLARLPDEAGFDMALAVKWLEICRKDHGEACDTLEGTSENTPQPSQPVALLAIDLDEMCICQMPQGSEYVALSYCWPIKTDLTLRRDNFAELSRPNAVLDNLTRLPGTVQDAIRCAKELPFPYLWIDALCIIQDDQEHKLKQLQQMDRVYTCASLTLVCAYHVAKDAIDPCDGFPGYGKPSADRKRSVTLVNKNRMMVTSPCVDVCIEQSRWMTRCWTFQEHQLSCRLLYFTPCQIYFQCSCATFCEDTVCETLGTKAYISPGHTLWSSKSRYLTAQAASNWGGWELNRAPLRTLFSMWEGFEAAIVLYTRRNVSYPTDILNAFEGVKAVLSESMQTDFWQGMPEKILPQALCWQLKGGFYRRRNWTPGQPPSAPLFPSWSWAGWESAINLNQYLIINMYTSDAEWYIVNAKSMATRLDVHPRGLSLRSQRPSPSLIKQFLHHIVPREEVVATAQEWRDARTLACWTTRAFLMLDGSHQQLGAHERLWPESKNFAIKDNRGVSAGCILLPPDFLEAFGVESMRCEFILISRSLATQSTRSYFDESVYEVKDWCHLNVMMISRPRHLGDYEALRVGVGIIHEDAWVAARPETDFVKLL